MKKTLYLLIAMFPLGAIAQTPIQPKSAAAIGNGGQEIKLKNPLTKLFELTENGADLKFIELEDLGGREGSVILDFETENGWPTAVQELQKSTQGEGWTAFTGGLALAPFQIEESLPPVKIGGVTVTLLPAVMGPDDKAPKILDDTKSGVFLVKSEGAMLSGTQGVVVGPRLAVNAADGSALADGKGLPVGILVRFDPPVTAAGFTHFNGDLVVAVFGGDGQLLGQIRQGAKPDATYFYGFEGDKGSIGSLFIGNIFPEDGVLDDVSFVP